MSAAVEQAPGDEDAHRHEGQQLDHRFEAAIAATMPSWRSVVSRWRVPKAMVKPASASAM
jgi:hypothetical protein